MARETFEDQAATVRRLLNGALAKGAGISRDDRRHLERAAHNLQAIGAFRQRLVSAAKSEVSEEQLDGIAEEILHLLHIQIPA